MTPTPRRTRKVVLTTKPGYRAAGYSRGGLLIRLAIDTVCRRRLPGVPRTIVLTSGTDSHATGAHPLPRAEAVDVRSKTFRSAEAKRRFLDEVMYELEDGQWGMEVKGGYEVLTDSYFGALEYEGKRKEHIHIQVRRGHTIGLAHDARD